MSVEDKACKQKCVLLCMQATAALKACQSSLERAADWLFSHAADLEASVNEVLEPNVKAPAASSHGRCQPQDVGLIMIYSSNVANSELHGSFQHTPMF